MDQRAAERGALLHAARKLPGRLVAEAFEAEERLDAIAIVAPPLGRVIGAYDVPGALSPPAYFACGASAPPDAGGGITFRSRMFGAPLFIAGSTSFG